jgi:hypothetical protein
MGQPGLLRTVKPGAAVIAAASGYECAAILTGAVPTITAVTRARPWRVRVAALLAFTVWLWAHMLRTLDEP